ncbi:MAG: IPTL-CTERM sorting domain-containing protein [Xanthomonadales bacterium]|nr:IPTL-CTERM sorting domain-containing protein [Xanthomonadales bacterium]
MSLRTVATTIISFAALCLLPLTAAMAQESAETLREQELARAAESAAAAPSGPATPFADADGPVEPGPLFAGVDDPAIDAVRIDVDTNAFVTAFSGVDVWGAAYDADNDRVLFNDGTALWEWPVGGAPNLLGTIMNAAGAAQSMVSLAWYDGTLYSTRNIANEAIYIIDTTTLVATVHIDYVDGDLDCGGLSVDQTTGEFYCTNDDATPHGQALLRVNPDASVTVIEPYPVGETDIDGLAVGGGRAYMVTDDAAGSIFVYDFAAGAYQPELSAPWPSSEIFAGGAWIGGAGGGDDEPVARFAVDKIFNDGNPAEVEVTISCNTGLPLQQSATISEGDGVVFVVTDFIDGTMDCEVTETAGVAGYEQEYDSGAGFTDGPCLFEAVGFGDLNTCVIANGLLEVDVDVTKWWMDDGPGFASFDYAEATFDCVNEQFDIQASGTLEFLGDGDTQSFSVFPHWNGTTSCDVNETVVENGVEFDDSECQGLVVTPGNGASCNIYNTRLFEGIPTLGQYGLALLAMLMLGVGFVAFRRYS